MSINKKGKIQNNRTDAKILSCKVVLIVLLLLLLLKVGLLISVLFRLIIKRQNSVGKFVVIILPTDYVSKKFSIF